MSDTDLEHLVLGVLVVLDLLANILRAVLAWLSKKQAKFDE